MIMKCADPTCRKEFDTWEHCAYRGRWCSRDCYLSGLDEHLERKWEAEHDERLIREMDEDDWRKNR